jgi:hypothetical protein
MRGKQLGADVAITIYDKSLDAVTSTPTRLGWPPLLAALTLKGCHAGKPVDPLPPLSAPGACKISQFATDHVKRMYPSKPAHPESEASDPAKPAGTARLLDESLRRLRSLFSRRLESFGLGESQSPLLTDSADSLDAEGNPR